MGRARKVGNATDPATGRPMPAGVTFRGPLQYRCRKMVDGARVTRTFETARLAREWLEATAVAEREGTFVDRTELSRWTVRELVQKFVDERMQDGGRRRGASEDRLGHVPAILGDAIADLKLNRLTSAAIRAFRDRQLKTVARRGGKCLSPGTVVKRLNLVASVIAYAISEWSFPFPINPASAEHVTRPEDSDTLRDRRLLPASAAAVRAAAMKGEEPPADEETRLFAQLAKSESADDVPIARLAIEQAMRQGEIFALKWEDIDFERRILTVRGRHERGTKNAKAQKSAKSRATIGWEYRPLMPRAAELLLAHRGDKEPDPKSLVFSAGTQDSFKTRFGRMAKRAGLKDFKFHDLRHEATSRLAKLYPNPLDLMRITGHKDVKSLNRYYQPDLSEMATRHDPAPKPAQIAAE